MVLFRHPGQGIELFRPAWPRRSVPPAILGQIIADAFGQELHGFAKLQLLLLHHKVVDIAPLPAGPALPRLLFLVHLKTGPVIIMKGTQASKHTAYPLQVDIRANQLDNIAAFLDNFGVIFGHWGIVGITLRRDGQLQSYESMLWQSDCVPSRLF